MSSSLFRDDITCLTYVHTDIDFVELASFDTINGKSFLPYFNTGYSFGDSYMEMMWILVSNTAENE